MLGLILFLSQKSIGLLSADELIQRFSAQTFTDANGKELHYRWYAPTTNADSSMPMVILLHGTSGRGRDNTTQFTDANRAAIKFLSEPSLPPCAIMVPQCPPNDQWVRTTYNPERHDQPAQAGPTMTLLLQAITTLTSKSSLIDSKRVYVIGNSMGGYGTWDLLSRAPTTIAAAIPICGGGDLQTAEQICHIPTWAFHGQKDSIVAAAHSQRMIEAMRAYKKGDARLTIFPGAGHNISTAVYATPGLATWLFAQRKP